MTVHESQPGVVCRFKVEGSPVGKTRPRVTTNGTYQPAHYRNYQKKILRAWRKAGGMSIGNEPFLLEVTVRKPRPSSHYRKNGELSAKGLKAADFPCVTPDLDNVAGTILDALNGEAWNDDRQAVSINIWRVWINRNDQHPNEEVLVTFEVQDERSFL